jgi:hypothetical protein
MIFVIHAQLGEGFFKKMEPVLDEKNTLYIGPKLRAKFLGREWWGFHIDYYSFNRLPASLERYDQIIIEELKINPNARRVKQLVTLLQTDPHKPIYFRPASGCWFDYIILEELRNGTYQPRKKRSVPNV